MPARQKITGTWDVNSTNESRLQWKQVQRGVTLAQLVKASVSQADHQRFDPHLGHNWLSCGVFLVKSMQALWAPFGTNDKAKLAISISGWLGRTNVKYLRSLPEERRTITVTSLSGL